MISWSFDFSGGLEEVIEHVKTVSLTRDQREHIAITEEGLTAKEADELSTGDLNERIAEHLGDFECYRRLILDELFRCRFPYAGVFCAWEDAPQHLGGYGIKLHVSGYEKDPRTA